MLKYFLFTLSMTGFIITCRAQISLGMNIGVQSTLSGLNDDSYVGFEFLNEKRPKTGIILGAIVEYNTSDDIVIQSGLNYMQKSFEVIGRYEVSGSAEYLNIPMRIKSKHLYPLSFGVGGGISTTMDNFRLEWELSGEIGMYLTESFYITGGYRQNLSTSGGIPLYDADFNGVGTKGFKFRSYYLKANYLFEL